MVHLEIKRVEPGHRDLMHLIGKLDEELLKKYPAEEVHGVNFEDPDIHKTVFIVAYLDNIPAGCGAIRPLDEKNTELKRFFVDRPFRKMGIAANMLSFLEEKAKGLHFETVKLEAGPEQPEAIRFYKKHGYREIERFGEYVNYELSLCYEKRII